MAGTQTESTLHDRSAFQGHTVLSRRHSHTSPQPYSFQISHGATSTVLPYSGLPAPASSSHIFDAVALNPDDPAIVKYSPINGDIIAATPARIIVQITSENFLDYELLSDFFLTVRAYLSTYDLLSLLMARFEWAINRFDDNGRVIRVRAFAALRHWILNYFSYDFLADRDLRVEFCNRLNALTQLVKGRAGYGASDLKLIADLKKCWTGRCSLFWDSLSSTSEHYKDLDIEPGGIIGSRDSRLVHQSQLRLQPASHRLGIHPPPLATGSTSIANWYSAVMEHGERQAYGHARQSSSTTSRSLPISPSSENGAPAISCSLPVVGPKKSNPYTNKALGIHPIPTTTAGRRLCPEAPPTSANDQARSLADHRRSGSFSDAARDKRAPLSSNVPIDIEEYAYYTSFTDRSLLRGHRIPPGGPYVSAVFSTSNSSGRSLQHGPEHSSNTLSEQSRGRSLGHANNPAVRSFIGNIRRALSSRYTGPKPASVNSSSAIPATSTLQSLGKSASVPLNVMFEATSSGQLESFRSVRVDLLAAEIYDSYLQAHKTRSSELRRQSDHAHDALAHEEQLIPLRLAPDMSHIDDNSSLRPPILRRLNSAMTDSSQSILIVDDTRPNAVAHGDPDVQPEFSLDNNGPQLEQAKDGIGRMGKHVRRQSDNLIEDFLERTMSTPDLQIDIDKQIFFQDHDGFRDGMWPTTSAFQLPQEKTRLRRCTSYQSTLTRRDERKSDQFGGGSPMTLLTKDNSPTRIIRRRPGGDLRANNNVYDLQTIERPASVGSMTTYGESIRGSAAFARNENPSKLFNIHKIDQKSSSSMKATMQAALAEKQPDLDHQTHPERRKPSFEAAVAHFAHIPDDAEGGIEATLLKLEGKYKNPIQELEPKSPPPEKVSEVASVYSRSAGLEPGNLAVKLHGENTPNTLSAFTGRDVLDGYPIRVIEEREHPGSTLYAASDDSNNSVPLLERSAHKTGKESPVAISWNDTSVLEERLPSSEKAPETPSTRRLRYGSIAPTATTDSFLLDENDEFISDSSSELSLDTIGAPEPAWSAHVSLSKSSDHIGHHDPPSPPMTIDQSFTANATIERSGQLQLPTPDPSPVSHHIEPDISGSSKDDRKIPPAPRHMPFILGHDAVRLAQQFTLVEQDALKEVDWRDLVDMRWQNTPTATTNWVEYLLTQDPLGIDLVTARFNIMVKWTLSEIVLTENIEERALTIVRYINIAQEARKLNNYATLLQLTIALTSADCTRLSKTWDLVPEQEKEALQDLEMLVSPRRGFQNLRVEMEKVNAEEGCIPVVFLYIQQLTFNAQKPSQVPGLNDGEPLVNFERYRSSAVIVKNLLRLIDASSKYTFRPIEGVVERCLWMACLTDEMITHTSKQQEYKEYATT